MQKYIFEISTPTFYKVVEYRSRCKTLNDALNIHLENWVNDTVRHFRLDTTKMTYAMHTYDNGQYLLKAYNQSQK